MDDWLATVPERIAADTAAVNALAIQLGAFAKGATLAELNTDQPQAAHLSQAALDAFKAELAAMLADVPTAESIKACVAACAQARKAINQANLAKHASQAVLQDKLDALAPQLKATSNMLEARHKQWIKLLDTAEKALRARLCKAFDGRAAREAKRALLATDTKKEGDATTRDAVLEALRQTVYFIHQGHWLHSRFPQAVFDNVPGLCRAVTVDEIAANDYSLTPGRYVGVAGASADDEEDFAEKMREIHAELAELNDKAVELAGQIARNYEELLG